MPVGNLRTAANNDQDDDPRALRPIPIATKDMVSFVEKNNNNAAGQNAEVVRFMFFNGFPQRLDLIVSRTMRRAHFFWFCSSLRLSENRIKREREKCALHRVLVFRISFSLSLARIFSRQSKRFESMEPLFRPLNAFKSERRLRTPERDEKDARRKSNREKTKECCSFHFLCTHRTALLLLSNIIHRERINWGKRNDRTTKWN